MTSRPFARGYEPCASLRPRLATTAAIASLIGFACAVPAAAAPAPDPAPPAARPTVAEARAAREAARAPSHLVFRDEFDGRRGTRPDGRNWAYNTGNGSGGWGNGEREYYTSQARNAQLDGEGHLVIAARKTGPSTDKSCWYGRCRYTSARLFTMDRFAARYGRIEARIQVPRGSGLWPAFWALAEENVTGGSGTYAEIDVMEHVGSEPDRVFSSLHGSRGSAAMHACTQYTTRDGDRFADAFHVYAVDWTDSTITFSVDGRAYVTRERAAYGSAWTFDRPMVLVLNLAVGGRWPGDPGPETAFPARMLVDYVRVYARASDELADKSPAPPTHVGGCDRAVGPA